MERQLQQSSTPGKPTRAQLILSIRRLRDVRDSGPADPARIVGTVLRIWCKRAYPRLAVRGVPWDKTLADAPAITGLVAQLERLPFLDAAYWLSTAYADLARPEYRKTLAMYFTPPPIAKRLMLDLQKEGARFAEHRFVDPACGGAAFLALVASRMRRELLKRKAAPIDILQHAQTHLAGVDLDKSLCQLTKHFLYMVFYPEICVTGRRPHFKIRCADSLTARHLTRFDVVVCNPPFRKLSQAEAAKHLPRFSEVMQYQPNIYALFIALTERLAKPNGIVGLVTPTSFLSGQYFGSLRTFLLRNTKVRHIGLVNDRERVYLDVEQETALTVLRATPPREHEVTNTAVSVVERDGGYRQIGKCPLPNSGTSWPLARDTADVKLLQSASHSPFRLSDYGYSPSIGGFVWNRDERPAYLTKREIPLPQRTTTVPLLWSSDIRSSGRLHFEAYTAAHGQHRYVNYGSRIHPTVKQHPAVLLQRVTSTDQARRLIGAVVSADFIQQHGGYVGENHVVILEHVKPDRGLPPKQLLRLLRTPLMERHFRCISGSSNVSLFELEQLPLPDPSRLRKMLRRGVPMERAVETLLLEDSAR